MPDGPVAARGSPSAKHPEHQIMSAILLRGGTRWPCPERLTRRSDRGRRAFSFLGVGGGRGGGTESLPKRGGGFGKGLNGQGRQ